ncbi:MAG: 50S ribosomal protein L9 [Bacteroidetes bacterium]|nr:50S ribosomal protein L9 [Bacteroidota bacterium]
MKVILLKNVDKLGEEGAVVNVKDGYGQNFLIPNGAARLATKNAIKAQLEDRRQASRKLNKKKEDAMAVAKQMSSLEIVVRAKVGEENRIFGSVTAQHVADALAAQGFSVDRRKVELEEDIRMLGVYTAKVKIHTEVTADVKVRVEPEEVAAE